MRNVFALICLGLSIIIPNKTTPLSAAEHSQRDSVTIYFRCSKADEDLRLPQNDAKLDSIVKTAQSLIERKAQINKITVRGSASPEGGSEYNITLSRRRAQSTLSALSQHLPQDNVEVVSSHTGDNWDELVDMVAASDFSDREIALELLSLPVGADSDLNGRKNSMKAYNNGQLWSELNRRFFPLLRKADIIIEYIKPQEELMPIPAGPEISLNALAAATPTGVSLAGFYPADTSSKKITPFLMAIKTNMLYDLLAVPNIGVEIPLPSFFSVGANWMYGWWKTDTYHRYWRVYGGDIYARKWFGNRGTSMTGHHVGIYANMITFDFEWGGRGYLAPRWSYGAGVEYGYSLKLTRRLNLDMNLCFGYLGGKEKEYIPDAGCYVWQVTKQKHRLTFTKVEVALSWLIGNMYQTNSKKGGKK